MKTLTLLVISICLILVIIVGLVVVLNHQAANRKNAVQELETVQPVFKKYIDARKEVTWVPNGGNGGDALIAQGTKDFFEKIGLKYQIGKEGSKYTNEVLVFGGGGNIVGMYTGGENFVKRNIADNTIIILPHTIKDVDEMLRMFKPSDVVFVRERKSYAYVKSVIPHESSLYLSKDMAFYINMKNMPTPKKGSGRLNFFRTDIEKKKGFRNPENNMDLSNMINYDPSMRDMKKVYRTTYEFLARINEYETVFTNRLHGGIGGYLMKKKVKLHDNSYGKNKAVYDYSLKKHSNVTFVK